MIRSRSNSKSWHRENSSLSVPPAAFSLHNSWIIESNQFRMAASLLFPNPCPLHKYKLWRFPFISFRALSFFPPLSPGVSLTRYKCLLTLSAECISLFSLGVSLYSSQSKYIRYYECYRLQKASSHSYAVLSALLYSYSHLTTPPHPSDIHSHTKKRSIRTFVFFFSTDSY